MLSNEVTLGKTAKKETLLSEYSVETDDWMKLFILDSHSRPLKEQKIFAEAASAEKGTTPNPALSI